MRLHADPFALFRKWFDQAVAAGLSLPEAMALATADGSGQPNARIVLLKGMSHDGFVFFTNYQSKKGRELTQNPRATLLFFWPQLDRQIRIEGRAEKISVGESEVYFQSRPKESRLGAWASPQSRPIPSRELLLRRMRLFRKRFGEAIPCPPHWGGYRVIPHLFEFWQGMPHRLHDRVEYRKTGSRWRNRILAP